jgi:N-acetylglucosaminyldiphosphoundecaprenol N-acetyl-beta-D-mannosaminyltransferase
MKHISFLGIRACALTKQELVGAVLAFARQGRRKLACYVNAHCVNVSFNDAQYRAILNQADLVYPGGKGVVLASRLFGAGFPERTNILDCLPLLCQELRGAGIRVYLLGNTPEVVEHAAVRLRREGIDVVGCRDGFFAPQEEESVIRQINAAGPDILFVGMGVPKQEKWAMRNRHRLEVNLIWTVGAAFDWLSARRQRAPRWMIESGLEWLHRLFQQPLRLCKRYTWGNMVFIARVMSWRLSKR